MADTQEVRELKQRVRDLEAAVDAANATSRSRGQVALDAIRELAKRLTPGNTSDKVIAAKVLADCNRLGARLDVPTQTLLQSI